MGPDSFHPRYSDIRNDVVAALRKVDSRWCAGRAAASSSSSDRAMAIGRRAQRPAGVNTAWGDEPESNHFGTHEFMDFIEQIGAQAFISVNVASGTPGEAQAWMQYLTGPASSGSARKRAQWTHRTLEGAVHRHRQRDLGLRRKHDRRVLSDSTANL